MAVRMNVNLMCVVMRKQRGDGRRRTKPSTGDVALAWWRHWSLPRSFVRRIQRRHASTSSSRALAAAAAAAAAAAITAVVPDDHPQRRITDVVVVFVVDVGGGGQRWIASTAGRRPATATTSRHRRRWRRWREILRRFHVHSGTGRHHRSCTARVLPQVCSHSLTHKPYSRRTRNSNRWPAVIVTDLWLWLTLAYSE